MPQNKKWIRIGNKDLIPIGNVTTITVEHETICLTRTESGYGALCNSCPHQGGPLGDGYIDERGWLLCSWHGYEYNPIDGSPPEGYDDRACSYDIKEDETGIYIAIPEHMHLECTSNPSIMIY